MENFKIEFPWNCDILGISIIHWISSNFEIKIWPTGKIPELYLAIRMNLQLTIYAISFTPETFPQTRRIVVAAIKAFNHFIFTVFNAIIA